MQGQVLQSQNTFCAAIHDCRGYQTGKPYTSNSTPYTLHPTPYTLHLTPYILHPAPCTLHPQPTTQAPTQIQNRWMCSLIIECVLFPIFRYRTGGTSGWEKLNVFSYHRMCSLFFLFLCTDTEQAARVDERSSAAGGLLNVFFHSCIYVYAYIHICIYIHIMHYT